jgi:bla regulator protein BlaR1
MTHELFAMLCRSALAATVALVIVLAARVPARRWLGPHTAYRLWLLVPVAAVAILLPAPVRPLAVAQQVAPSLQVPAATIDLNATIASTPFDVQPWLLAAWMIGACALLLWFVLQQRRYLSNLGALVDADAGTLRAQTSVGSPALVGALRPRIVLPSDFESRYTQRERELVLAHERVHLHRGDAQINALVALLRCLNWFNPLFHLAASRFRFDQELACDALVVARFPEARRCYADAMLKAQLAGQARQELRLPAGCYWPSSHPLKERIAMLKFPELSRSRRAIAAVVIAVLTLSTGYASWAAQPGRSSSDADRPAESASGDTGPLIQTDFLLTIDGRKIADSQDNHADPQHGINGPDRWTVSYDTTKDGMVKYDDKSFNIFSRAGKMFTITAQRTDEVWELTGAAADLGDGTIQFNSTLKHNGAIVSRPSLVVVNGETAAIQIGDDLGAGGFKGFRLDLRLNLAKITNDTVSAAKTQAPLPADVPPTEILASRKLKPPRYPPEAVKNHVTGKVVLKVHVDEQGAPLSAEVQSVEPETAAVLADVAIAAAMQWRFNPGIRNGRPDDGYVLVPVDFALTNDDGSPVQAAAPPVDKAISYRNVFAPKYPPEAIANRITGKLFIKAHVGADGNVIDAYVDQAFPLNALALADVAVPLIKQWQFNPQTQNGQAVDGQVTIPLEFKIDGYTAALPKEPVPTMSADTRMLSTITVVGTLQ